MESDNYFRAGVGLIVVNGEGMVLGLERSDVRDSWQLPQGGIAIGEEPAESAQRELMEETGIKWHDTTLVDVYPSWLAYELPASSRSPKTGRGQVQLWFLLRFNGQDDDIHLKPANGEQEFTRWRWMPIGDLVAAAWEVRQPIYWELATHWSAYLS